MYLFLGFPPMVSPTHPWGGRSIVGIINQIIMGVQDLIWAHPELDSPGCPSEKSVLHLHPAPEGRGSGCSPPSAPADTRTFRLFKSILIHSVDLSRTPNSCTQRPRPPANISGCHWMKPNNGFCDWPILLRVNDSWENIVYLLIVRRKSTWWDSNLRIHHLVPLFRWKVTLILDMLRRTCLANDANNVVDADAKLLNNAYFILFFQHMS